MSIHRLSSENLQTVLLGAVQNSEFNTNILLFPDKNYYNIARDSVLTKTGLFSCEPNLKRLQQKWNFYVLFDRKLTSRCEQFERVLAQPIPTLYEWSLNKSINANKQKLFIYYLSVSQKIRNNLVWS